MSLPKTYKAAVLEEANKPPVIKDVELKLPSRGEILVKVLATGVCHSDLGVQAGQFGPLPRIPGHETIGDVVAVGDGEDKWKVGDRVGAPWHGGHCGFCKSCKKGFFQMCDQGAINGVSRDGGYAEYVLLRREAVVTVPKDVEPKEFAPILCAGVTVFNALRQQNITTGELVGVQGLGGLGHLAIQFAANQGYRVVAISSSAAKEKFAKELGAEIYIDGSKGDIGKQLQELGGVACILATSPNEEIMSAMFNGLGKRGKLVILGVGQGNINVPSLPFILKGLSVTGWPSGHAVDSEEAIAFAKAKNVKVITEYFKLDQAAEAMQKVADGKMHFRGVLVFD